MFPNFKNHKNKDVVFMENSMGFRSNLEIIPSERNEGPTVVIVDESSKSSSCDDDDEREE